MSLYEKIKVAFQATVSEFTLETESQDYDACRFQVNGMQIHYRKAKITPKKEGQFVTFWKRIPSGIIAPFDTDDTFSFLIVAAEHKSTLGYFVFPKSVLVARKIVSTSLIEGKRAFRIYPPTSVPTSKQALSSQKWQGDYFIRELTLAPITHK